MSKTAVPAPSEADTELRRAFEAANDLPRWASHAVVLAVSGGADSTAMLRLFANVWRERFPASRLLVAHANHQLRGAESDADAMFVRRLCDQLQIPCTVGQLDIRRTADGLEADARRERYSFLERVAARWGARYVATAHNRNDQVETVLLRMLRGTGIVGLAGIAPCRALNPAVSVIRPLLPISRDQILAYLHALGQDFRSDASNSDTALLRNRLRHSLLPILRTEFSQNVDAALLRIAAHAAEVGAVLRTEAQRVLEQALISPRDVASEACRLDGERLRRETHFMRAEVFRTLWATCGFHQRDMNEARWRELAAMLDAPGSVRTFPGGIRVHVRRSDVEIENTTRGGPGF